MWGLQKYQNHYEILFGRGCIDLENSAILLLLAQGKSAPFSFFEDCNMTKYLTNIFLLWINVNRLCSHVGLKFWTPNSFMCPKLTIFSTWKFRFTTLYKAWEFLEQARKIQSWKKSPCFEPLNENNLLFQVFTSRKNGQKLSLIEQNP